MHICLFVGWREAIGQITHGQSRNKWNDMPVVCGVSYFIYHLCGYPDLLNE